jgi:putative hydrolase of HD superfamily
MNDSVLPALLALLPLDRLPRTGWILRGIGDPESIAGHVLGTCHVILALGPRVEPELDVERCLALALVHDAPEALLGDIPRTGSALLPSGAKAAAEDAAARALLAPLSDLARDLFAEHRAGSTREARFTRLCDRLQMGVRLAGYEREGRRGLDDFRATIAALDASEFAPAESLRSEILAALHDPARGGR